MKRKVVILYGGRSVEHEISIRSAKNVYANLDEDLFDVTAVGISKSGDWYLTKNVTPDITSGEPVSLQLSVSAPVLMTSAQHIDLDIVFPILHGTDGEDGSIQGLFKAVGRPVVGSSVLGSAVAMNKITSKRILQQAGIPISSFMSFHITDQIDFDTVKDHVGLPMMIKAGNLGSSVGISKVSEKKDFEQALQESFRYASEIVIESFIEGRELECAVMGNQQPETSVPGEIILKKEYDFYTYEAKYEDDDAIDIQIPAQLPDHLQEAIRRHCAAAFRVLGCNDYARVDVFLTHDNQVLINEINTIPGFTDVSMFPMMWDHMGLSYRELLTRLIEISLNRHEQESKLETSYSQP